MSSIEFRLSTNHRSPVVIFALTRARAPQGPRAMQALKERVAASHWGNYFGGRGPLPTRKSQNSLPSFAIGRDGKFSPCSASFIASDSRVTWVARLLVHVLLRGALVALVPMQRSLQAESRWLHRRKWCRLAPVNRPEHLEMVALK